MNSVGIIGFKSEWKVDETVKVSIDFLALPKDQTKVEQEISAFIQRIDNLLIDEYNFGGETDV